MDGMSEQSFRKAVHMFLDTLNQPNTPRLCPHMQQSERSAPQC